MQNTKVLTEHKENTSTSRMAGQVNNI